MAADVPTMLLMIITSSLMMAVCMAVVGWARRSEGLGHWASALLLSALGHLLLLLRGRVPDALSIVAGNVLLASVVLCIIAALYRFQGRAVPWTGLLAMPVLVLVLVSLYRDSFTARVGLVGTVIGLQSLWAVGVTWQGRRTAVGRGQWLVMAGLALEALVLGARALVPVFMGDGATDILQGSRLQTLTFMASFGVVLVSSTGFVFMSRDRADEDNRVMAALDPLTGVANRRSLIAALDRDVARALRTREAIALMMVDVDHFKHINDQYGHPVGDRVLCGVVDVLRQRLRAQDLVGRYGGEEFMVLLPDTGLEGAEQLARELCRAVEASRCPADGVPAPGIAVTVSIGVFGGRLEPGDSWDMLIAAADRALYQAKENGRNRVEVATTLRRPGGVLAQSPAETLPPSRY